MPTHPTLQKLKSLRARIVANESVSFHDVVELIDLATEGESIPPAVPTPVPPATGETGEAGGGSSSTTQQ